MLPSDQLRGKVALVSGGASGIGQAVAVAYGRAGVHSIVGYYPDDPHDVNDTVLAVEEAGGRCTPVAVDVRSAEQVDSFAQTAITVGGRLDIVVAAAGIARRAPLEDLDERLWEETLSVDLSGVLRVFRSGAARIAGPGAMVAVSSIAGGLYGWNHHAHYTAAKAGVIGLCRSLAIELAPRAIRVNTVIPGLIRTPQTLDPVNSLGAANLERAGGVIPLGRVGDADEVAKVIVFLTGEDSSYVTGQELVVDGGLAVRRPD
jgi:3-oxoacyl-[acyl-carrier protein] reductase